MSLIIALLEPQKCSRNHHVHPAAAPVLFVQGGLLKAHRHRQINRRDYKGGGFPLPVQTLW